jgi:hypothetical protein
MLSALAGSTHSASHSASERQSPCSALQQLRLQVRSTASMLYTKTVAAAAAISNTKACKTAAANIAVVNPATYLHSATLVFDLCVVCV